MALDHVLYHVGRRRVEIGGRLVEEEHLRLQRPGAREREALLLAEGEHARRHTREGAEAGALQGLRDQLPALGPGDAPEAQRKVDVGGGPSDAA